MLRGSFKEPSTPKASGLAHLMTALHQNAAAVVNSKTQLNGPDQVGYTKLSLDYLATTWAGLVAWSSVAVE